MSEKDPLDYPERMGGPDEVSYIKLHHKRTGEKYIYMADDCKFHGKPGLWKVHLEWLEFKALLGLPSYARPMCEIASTIAMSRFWVVDELCTPYEEPGQIYG